ncbi:23S rRNA (guanosine-2'-O-)-methyltransferase RlmB [mine drainage metagenome]|uniref:23S rRNA (Guanosine-2'-O-)-methyltransferase RlmB n=1 Tax=mine drainage metagenome TaxID=410659 RepID=A0A1J5RMP7_9ZZZZ
MLSRNEIKYIQSLCHKKQRQLEGLFIAEGPKIAEELLNSDFTIKKIYALPEWIAKNAINDIEVETIDEIDLSRISQLQTPHQVVIIAAQKNDFSKPVLKNKLSIVLDGIQDPGNMGTIIRIADWFGIENIICSEDTVELYNPKVIQSTMGSFVRTKVYYSNLNEFLKTVDVPVFGAMMKGENMYELQKPKEGLLVIGNEGKGIRNEILQYITNPITIPKKGGAESLNAAVAMGIILSHLV